VALLSLPQIHGMIAIPRGIVELRLYKGDAVFVIKSQTLNFL
jgi:hypothetical protein